MPRSRSSTLNGSGDGTMAAQFTFTNPATDRKPRRPSITAFLTNAFSPLATPSSTAAPAPNTSTSATPLTSTVNLPHTGSSDSVDSVSALNGHNPGASIPASPAQTRSSTPNKLSRRMRRSYSHSTSHARTGSMSTAGVGGVGVPMQVNGATLGQGATVVRTPQDATMFMAQPSALLGHLPSRQSSLRGGPRRPSDEAPLTEHKVVNPPAFDAPSSSTALRPAFEPLPARTLSRSPSAPTHAASSSRTPVDNAAGYHPVRRLGTRASSSALHATAAPSSRNPYAPNYTPAAPAACAPSDQQFQQLSHNFTRPYVPPRVSPPLSNESVTLSPSSRRNAAARPSNASQDTLTPLLRPWAPITRALPTPSPSPSPPVLVSCNSRPTTDPGSTVLVTLRFGYSLDAEPNTHAITITMDTLRPAGGILVDFLKKVLDPSLNERDSGIGSSGSGTPIELPGPEMTDGSSAEESDYDDCVRDYFNDLESASPVLPASPGRACPPSAFTYPALPPLADLPAALAQAKANAGSAPTTPTTASLDGHEKQLLAVTAPLRVGRPRASTCPSRSAAPAAAPAGTMTEVTVLLQREASAWHMIASRLCSGSWPCLDGRRRRVEDECKLAGMAGLVAELAAPTGVVRPSASGTRSYI